MHRLKTLAVVPLLLAMATTTPGNGSASSTDPVLAPGAYGFDIAHSSVGFKVKHMVIATVRGKFNEFTGSVIYDPENLDGSSVEATIKIASVDTDNERRDNHLRSAEFFDAETYPDMTFKSKKIEKREEGLVAVGDLTIRGVTKEVDLQFELIGPITDMQGMTRYGVDASMKLNRHDFGVSWNRTLDNGGVVVSDMITVEIHMELVSQ